MIDPAIANPGWSATLRRKWATLRAQPLAILALVPLCWLMIAISDLIIIAIPFRRLAPWAGGKMAAGAMVPLTSECQQARARAIGRAIVIAARAAPFRSNCYPQALTAVALCACAGVPTALFFGAAFGDEDGTRTLQGHAWLVSGPVTITGGADSFERFPPLGCFVRW